MKMKMKTPWTNVLVTDPIGKATAQKMLEQQLDSALSSLGKTKVRVVFDYEPEGFPWAGVTVVVKISKALWSRMARVSVRKDEGVPSHALVTKEGVDDALRILERTLSATDAEVAFAASTDCREVSFATPEGMTGSGFL